MAPIEGEPKGSVYPPFNALMYSVDTGLPFLSFRQENYWYPDARRECLLREMPVHCGKYLEWFLWVHVALGWALATLGVVGLTALVRRE